MLSSADMPMTAGQGGDAFGVTPDRIRQITSTSIARPRVAADEPLDAI